MIRILSIFGRNMSKHLFLTSSIHGVAREIAAQIDSSARSRGVFITTGVKDKVHVDLAWHERNIVAMREAGFVFDYYDIAGKSTEEIIRDLSDYKYMYVEGGNPYYLLHCARQCDFAKSVKQQLEQGMIYIGTSAGSMVVGRDIGWAARPGKSPADYNMTDTTAFQIVNFDVAPHWGHSGKRDLYQGTKLQNMYKESHPYLMISDAQYIEVTGDSWQIHTKQES